MTLHTHCVNVASLVLASQALAVVQAVPAESHSTFSQQET